MERFDQLAFNEAVKKTIKDLKFEVLTPIQEMVIPLVYKHESIIGISQTGTGKTHAFLLPMIDRIDLELDEVQAVITTPTRELATQIYNEARKFVDNEPNLRVSLMIGGSDKQKAINKLVIQPHLVIGTPGRIKDLAIDELALKITTANMFVVDEADMTLEFGYLEDLDIVLGQMKENLQIMVFSATIPLNLRVFLKKYMSSPKLIEIEEKKVSNENIEHVLVPTKHKDRYQILRNVMQHIDPYLCIIFCNTREDARNVAKKLYDEGIRVGEIHGDLEPRTRRQMMRRIQNQEYQYIVATDIAARGIDIDGASHIISMEFPYEIDFYIHRSGRCGRGKYTGVSYSLYDTKDDKIITALEKKGIEFIVKDIKDNQWIVVGEREKRKVRVRKQNELETEISKIVRKPTKVKPGYKKKRQRKINELVRKQKRQIIRQDIRRQKKERAKIGQAKNKEDSE